MMNDDGWPGIWCDFTCVPQLKYNMIIFNTNDIQDVVIFITGRFDIRYFVLGNLNIYAKKSFEIALIKYYHWQWVWMYCFSKGTGMLLCHWEQITPTCKSTLILSTCPWESCEGSIRSVSVTRHLWVFYCLARFQPHLQRLKTTRILPITQKNVSVYYIFPFPK